MTLTPLSRWEGMPSYFNVRAADAVFDVISKMAPEEAEVAADLIVGELFQGDLLRNASVVEKALADHVERHGEAIRKGLVRTYISKRQHGEDVIDVIAAADVVSKAVSGDRWNRDEHGHFASVETRARKARQRAVEENDKLFGGDFVHSHHPIVTHPRDAEGNKVKPLSDKVAERAGIPEPAEAMTPAQKLRYQQAYRQVQAIVGSYAPRDAGDHFVHLHTPQGEEVHALADFEAGAVPITPGLRAISVSRIPGFEHDDFTAYDTLRAMGGAAGRNFSAQPDEYGNNPGVDRIRSLNDSLKSQDHLDRAGTRVMRRMGAASQFLDESFGDSMPRSMKAATKAGQVVGLYGPEAQKVVGPAADKAAYRYRGTERTPDRRLTNTLEAIRRAPGVHTPADARELAVHGIETDAGWRPSGVLNYFRGRLPDSNLNTLQRKSGTIPPSEGVMFDKTGKLVTQAVGYGDDHYLPFNLKNLKPLRGGEYIRTRTLGGPTTEDIYTGLVAGAKSMSVVSHNGVYTVEFDESFKGSRRYNDKAARMVARYGQLLDAVKNGEITTGRIDPNREAEIAAEAESSFDPDTEPGEFRNEFERLMTRERRNPTFSAAQRAQAAQSFLDDEALKHRTPDGHEMTREELVEGWLNEQAGREIRAAREQGIGGLNADDVRADIARTHGLNDPDPVRMSENAIRAMGSGDRFNRYLEREEKSYRASLQPMKLNGPGYEMALNALREQFPYYINNVEFHPWSDAQDGIDTGYVKPKHNRPAAALAGYFDESLGGKARADTIRGQNHRSEPVAYRTRTQRVAEQAKERATGAAESARTAVGGGTLSSSEQKELRYQTDKQVAEALRSQTRFGSGMALQGEFKDITNQVRSEGPERLQARDWAAIAPAVKELRDTPAGELDRMDAAKLRGMVAAAMKEVDQHKLFDIDPKLAAAHANDGRAPKIASYDRTDTAGNLRSMNDDKDYGKAILMPGRELDPARVQDAYAADAKANVLGLPALDDPGFNAAADAMRADLDRRQGAILQAKMRGGRPPANHNQVPHLVEGLSRAKQYRRRYDEAQAAVAEREAAVIATPGGGGLTTLAGPNGMQIQLGFSPAEGRASQGSTLQGGLTPIDTTDMSAFENQFK